MLPKILRLRPGRAPRATLLLLALAGSAHATVVSFAQAGDKQAGDQVTFKLDQGLMRGRVCQPDVVQVQHGSVCRQSREREAVAVGGVSGMPKGPS